MTKLIDFSAFWRNVARLFRSEPSPTARQSLIQEINRQAAARNPMARRKTKLTGEHWTWIVVALGVLAGLDHANTWAEVFEPKGIAKLAAVALAMYRVAKVPAK